MKKLFIIFFSLLLIVIIYVIGTNLINKNPVNESDQKSIAATVNNYYTALESNNFQQALTYVYQDGKSMNTYVNLQSNVIALSEVFGNIITDFHRASICNYENVFYDKYEKSYYAPVSLNLKYKNTPGGLVNEYLYLNKYSGKWKIVNIKSCDRYVMYRSNNYNVATTTWFLIPNKQ